MKIVRGDVYVKLDEEEILVVNRFADLLTRIYNELNEDEYIFDMDCTDIDMLKENLFESAHKGRIKVRR